VLRQPPQLLSRQLQVDCSDGVVQVYWLGRVIDRRRDRWLVKQPGEAHLRSGDTALACDRSGELRVRGRKNVVQARSFSEMLEETIRRYRNRAIEAAQVIEELIELAKDMREADARGEVLGLSDDELAFYDALGVNDSAVQVLGNDELRRIAQELVATVRKNVTID
jgi:type I restriction enzyme R subunit